MDANTRRRDDRRSRRTRRLVTSAMTELLLEKPYAAITVQDILDRADVGRATFYGHFRDKLDVVDAVVGELFQAMGPGDVGPVGQREVRTGELFRHAADRHRSLRAMVDTPGSEVFWSQAQATWTSMIASSLPGAGRLAPPGALVAQFATGGVVSVLKWWMREGMPIPPEEVARDVDALLVPLLAGRREIGRTRS